MPAVRAGAAGVDAVEAAAVIVRAGEARSAPAVRRTDAVIVTRAAIGAEGSTAAIAVVGLVAERARRGRAIVPALRASAAEAALVPIAIVVIVAEPRAHGLAGAFEEAAIIVASRLAAPVAALALSAALPVASIPIAAPIAEAAAFPLVAVAMPSPLVVAPPAITALIAHEILL